MSSLRKTSKSGKSHRKQTLTVINVPLKSCFFLFKASFIVYELVKMDVLIVGVAKFLGCEKTLVKNPSQAQQNLWRETSDCNWITFLSLFFLFFLDQEWGGGGWGVEVLRGNRKSSLSWTLQKPKRKRWGAEEKRTKKKQKQKNYSKPEG